MPAPAAAADTEMRIAKVVGFGPPLAEEPVQCVVLEDLPGDRRVVIEIGSAEAFSLAATLQGLEFGRPMTYQFAAGLLRGLGGRIRRVQVDRMVEGAYAATVEVEGPAGVRPVDARASDALNLAAIASAPVFVSPQVMADSDRRQQDDSAAASLLRMAAEAPAMTITKGPPA